MGKDRHISLRVSEADYEAIRAAADAAGRSMSEHLRRSAVSSGARRVPELNRSAWQKLAPAISNLNQLAHQANRFAVIIRESGLKPNALRAVVELMRSTKNVVRELRDDVQSLRRDLYGAAPLELAADVLEDWERAANLGRVPVGRDRLRAAIHEVRELAVLLGEVER